MIVSGVTAEIKQERWRMVPNTCCSVHHINQLKRPPLIRKLAKLCANRIFIAGKPRHADYPKLRTELTGNRQPKTPTGAGVIDETTTNRGFSYTRKGFGDTGLDGASETENASSARCSKCDCRVDTKACCNCSEPRAINSKLLMVVSWKSAGLLL